MPAGQDEPVAAQPVHIARIMPHHPLEQRVGQRRQTHSRTRMPIADLLHGIRRQHPSRIDRPGIGVGPVVGVVRLGQFGNLFGCGQQALLAPSHRLSQAVHFHPRAAHVSAAGVAAR